MWTGVHYWDLETIYQISHRLPQQRWLLLMRIVKRNLHMTKITRSQNVILNKHDSMLLNKFTKGGNQSSIYSGTCAIRHLSFPTQIYCPIVFLLTKIKPEYSDILYHPTHFWVLQHTVPSDKFLSIPSSCTIRHISLLIWSVGLDRFHCMYIKQPYSV